MVSQTVEYALRAVVWLAHRRGVPQASQQIAEATGVSSNYLPKVLQPLVRCGMVSGVRGVHGGYCLERDPAELRVLEVVNLIEPITRVDRCPACLPEHEQQLCPLHRLLDDAAEVTQKRFADVTIQDLAQLPVARDFP